MKIWKLSQTDRNDYDTYDSMVVVANTAEEAQQIHPDREWYIGEDAFKGSPWDKKNYRTWASSPSKVLVEYIGELAEISDYDENNPIICASFNAG